MSDPIRAARDALLASRRYILAAIPSDSKSQRNEASNTLTMVDSALDRLALTPELVWSSERYELARQMRKVFNDAGPGEVAWLLAADCALATVERSSADWRRLTGLWRYGVAVCPPTCTDFYNWLGILDAAIDERTGRDPIAHPERP